MGFIKFLGTAGARFVMITQLRASGGMWLSYAGTNILIDPGPGSIVRCSSVRPKLDPGTLDAVILTHKHLDHSNDINVMIEAMTQGGFKKRGLVFAPPDAYGEQGVILRYLRDFPEKMIPLREGDFGVGNIRFNVPVRNQHSGLTYGFKFFLGTQVVSLVGDTRYFDAIADFYRDSSLLILNVVFYERRADYEHLCLADAIVLIKAIKPRKTIITHFGMSMLKHNPPLIEKRLKREVSRNIQFAHDGLSYKLTE